MTEKVAYPHPSIVNSETDVSLTKCISDRCGCRWVHCPLCAPGRIGVGTQTFMQKHFDRIHVLPSVNFSGLKLLVCLLKCTTQKHYHCPKCGDVILKATKAQNGIKEHLSKCDGQSDRNNLSNVKNEVLEAKNRSLVDGKSDISKAERPNGQSSMRQTGCEEDGGCGAGTVMFPHVSILEGNNTLEITPSNENGQMTHHCLLCGATVKSSHVNRHRGQHMSSQIRWGGCLMLGCSLESCLTMSSARRSRYQLHFHCPWCAEILPDRRSAVAHYGDNHGDVARCEMYKKEAGTSSRSPKSVVKQAKPNGIVEDETFEGRCSLEEVFDEASARLNSNVLNHIHLPLSELCQRLTSETGVSCNVQVNGLSLAGSWKELTEAREFLKRYCLQENETHTGRKTSLENSRKAMVVSNECQDSSTSVSKLYSQKRCRKKNNKLKGTLKTSFNNAIKATKVRKRKLRCIYKVTKSRTQRRKSSTQKVQKSVDSAEVDTTVSSPTSHSSIQQEEFIERNKYRDSDSMIMEAENVLCDSGSKEISSVTSGGVLQRNGAMVDDDSDTAMVPYTVCSSEATGLSPVAAAEQGSGDVPHQKYLLLENDHPTAVKENEHERQEESSFSSPLKCRDKQDDEQATDNVSTGDKIEDKGNSLCHAQSDGVTGTQMTGISVSSNKSLGTVHEGDGMERCPVCCESMPLRQLVKHVLVTKKCRLNLEALNLDESEGLSMSVRRLIIGQRDIVNCTCPSCGLKKNCMSQALYHYAANICRNNSENIRRNREFFRQHGVIHDPLSKLYKCSHCNIQARKPIHLRNHIEAVHLPKVFSCPHCPRRFATREKKEYHMRVHIDLVECEHCGKNFMKSYLPQHIAKIHREMKVRCTMCDFVTKSDVYLQRHVENRHSSGHHLCEWCGKHFGQKTTMLRHVNAVHLGIKYKRKNPTKLGKGTCSICGLDMLKKNLNTHIQRRHQGLKMFTCDICGTAFTSKHSVKVHKLKHMSEEERSELQKYACELCGQRFYKKYLQQEHIKAHGALYDCQKCGKHFRYRHSLLQHQRRPGVCKVPGSGDVFKCELCPKTYPSLQRLENHVTKAHPSDTEISEAWNNTAVFAVKEEGHETDTQPGANITEFIVQEVEEADGSEQIIQGGVIKQILSGVNKEQEGMPLVWSKSNSTVKLLNNQLVTAASQLVTESSKLVTGNEQLDSEVIIDDVAQLVKIEDGAAAYDSSLNTQTFAMIQSDKGAELQINGLELQPVEELIMIQASAQSPPYCPPEDNVQYQCGHCNMLFVSMEDVNSHVNLCHM